MTKFTTASKKAMSLLLAMLLTFSCMAVAASAAAPEFTKYVLNATNCTLDVKKKQIEVKKAVININNVDYTITFKIENESVDRMVNDETKNTIFYNLVEGKSYTVKGTIVYDTETYSATNEFTIKLKNGQNAPTAPVPSKIKATSIEVNATTGIEYAILPVSSSDEPVYSDSAIFKNLNPQTQYCIYARYKETETAYASPAAKAFPTTLAASDQTPPATPVLIDKTDRSITVAAVAGQIYSKDGGVNWQTSNVFKDLTPNTDYMIVTRKTYTSGEEETPISDGLPVHTNERACYAASINKCYLNLNSSDPLYNGTEFSFYFTCDNPGTTELTYGDTRFVPATFSTNQGEGEYSCSVKTSFTPTATGDLVFTVKFNQQKYTGSDWVTIGTATQTYTFEVHASSYRIVVLGQKLLSFLLNDIPQGIVKILQFGFLKKIIDMLNNLGKTSV